MSQRARTIEEAHDHVASGGRRIKTLFSALLALDCLAAAAFIALAALGLAAHTAHNPLEAAGALVPPLATFVVLGGAVWELRSIADSIARGTSPFTPSHARRIAVIGWLFVANAAVELLFSPGFAAIALGPFEFVTQPSAAADFPLLPVDVSALITAIVCFALAALWRYGSLIQSQVDDLV